MPENPARFTPDVIATSRDGTAVPYSRTGEGPGLVLVHGAMQTAVSFDALASSLARSHGVVRYDRRGRGHTRAGGIDGAADRLARETEDLVAIIAATSSRYVFGLSSGAILTMFAVLETPCVEKMVLYEPPFTRFGVDPADWSEAFLRALAEDRLGTAMARLLEGTADRGLLGHVPRPVLSLLFGLAVRKDVRARNGASLRELLLTVPADIAIQREASRALSPIARFTTPTLLLGGDRSHPKLTRVLDGLERELPDARREVIRGAGHTAADNGGKPADVARAITAFVRA